MTGKFKKSAVVACAAVMGFGVGFSRAATIIEGGSSAVIDGWSISAPVGVALVVDASGSNQVNIEKTADFVTPGQAYQVTFDQVGAGAAASIDFTSESITNSTGAAFNGFTYSLINSAGATAVFAGLSETFIPPVGTNVSYTAGSLSADKDTLTYTGTQSSPSISDWGGTTAGDELLIDANPGTGSLVDFALQEQPGVGSVGPVVPLPASVWQSLAGLLGLGAISYGRRIKRKVFA